MFLKIKWTSNLSTRSIFTLSLCDCVWAAIATDRLAGAKWVAAFLYYEAGLEAEHTLLVCLLPFAMLV